MIFVVLPQVEILDLAGPLQAFHEANASRVRHRIRLVAPRERIETHHGVVLADLDPLPESAGEALVIVPGMPYARTEKLDRGVVRWLARAAREGAHLASVCTGAFVLGEAGLLDGRRCTTHWSRTGELARRFPRARVLVDRLFVSDGNVTTSAGIASGIDMALALIEQSEGPLVAAEVAREMVVYLRRDGSEKQESVYLDYRTHLNPGVHRAQDWMVRHPSEPATLESLAEIAGMSSRSLTRTFREATGISVHEFATRVRLELAKTLMSDPTLTMDAIAQRCGFTSARHLRRYGLRRR
ncbi:MAG TPA: DJ-1/PfpI family protein [Thermoanaerobaculia bacterium]|nr:DJ-1/PfpI family protein [Thermoanaerobaculia bacterium]